MKTKFKPCDSVYQQIPSGSFEIPEDIKPPGIGTYLDVPYGRGKIINALISQISHRTNLNCPACWVCGYMYNGAPYPKPVNWKFVF